MSDLTYQTYKKMFGDVKVEKKKNISNSHWKNQTKNTNVSNQDEDESREVVYWTYHYQTKSLNISNKATNISKKDEHQNPKLNNK